MMDGDRIPRFEFASAGRIIFGPGTLREAGPIARELGTRALVVTGQTVDRAAPLLAALSSQRIAQVRFQVAEEPTIDLVREGVSRARSEGCDLVIGFGGGSALDAAKAIAALLTNTGELLDYLEVIGHGKPLTHPAAPFLAIPTTAGTGTEVTRNAVLASPTHRVKVSLRSPLLLARVALVDPELTYRLPPALTASTGLDALTQVIEPYVSPRANPMTDTLCVDGMQRVARSLRRAFEHSQNLPGAGEPLAPEVMAAREDMALASLFGGLALANAGLGAVHGFAGPVGGMFPAPHGAVCAALLPHVMKANVLALHERARGVEASRRYDRIAKILTGNDSAKAADGILWVRDLCAELQTMPLSTYGVTEKDFPPLIEKAAKASSIKANPVVLTPEELRDVLAQAI